MSQKICPGCYRSFTCDGDNDCWCESVQLHRSQMQEIMETYTDCLCESCLRKYERD